MRHKLISAMLCMTLATSCVDMDIENVELNYRGEDVRPAFWLNNVGKTELIQVNYTGSKNVGAIMQENTGTVIKR